MSVPVSDIVTPARLTEGHPATSFAVAVGFGVGVGDGVGTGDAVGVAVDVGSAVGVGVAAGGVAALVAHPASSTMMVSTTSTRVVR
jgi:hypothetical protein